MAPRSFSTDGAQGAMGGGGDGSSSGSSSADQMWANNQSALNDWNNNTPGSYTSGADGLSYSSNDHGWGSYDAHALAGDAGVYTQSNGDFSFTPEGAPNPSPISPASTFSGKSMGGMHFGFDDGGSMPDTGDAGAGNDLVGLALATVDSALQYGRQKYGLAGAGGDESGGSTQTAAAMPTIPGNQSNTPGPYVPQQPKPQKQAGAMPTIPGNQSETPGPYKPGGGGQKLAAAMPTIPGNQSNTPGPYVPQQPPQPQQGAIPDDQEEAA